MSTVQTSLVCRLFDGLAGEWTFDRTIEGYGTMCGAARFSPCEGGLLYREEGVIRLFSGASNPAFREFVYRHADGAIVVFFHNEPLSKGVLFRLEPTFESAEPWPAWAEAEHLCREDLYRGRYVFESPDRFRTVVRIEGPEKSTLIVTGYARLSYPRGPAARYPPMMYGNLPGVTW